MNYKIDNVTLGSTDDPNIVVEFGVNSLSAELREAIAAEINDKVNNGFGEVVDLTAASHTPTSVVNDSLNILRPVPQVLRGVGNGITRLYLTNLEESRAAFDAAVTVKANNILAAQGVVGLKAADIAVSKWEDVAKDIEDFYGVAGIVITPVFDIENRLEKVVAAFDLMMYQEAVKGRRKFLDGLNDLSDLDKSRYQVYNLLNDLREPADLNLDEVVRALFLRIDEYDLAICESRIEAFDIKERIMNASFELVVKHSRRATSDLAKSGADIAVQIAKSVRDANIAAIKEKRREVQEVAEGIRSQINGRNNSKFFTMPSSTPTDGEIKAAVSIFDDVTGPTSGATVIVDPDGFLAETVEDFNEMKKAFRQEIKNDIEEINRALPEGYRVSGCDCPILHLFIVCDHDKRDSATDKLEIAVNAVCDRITTEAMFRKIIEVERANHND